MVGHTNWTWDSVNKIMVANKEAGYGDSWATAYDFTDVQKAITEKGWTGIDWTEAGNVFSSGIKLKIGNYTYFWCKNQCLVFKNGILTADGYLFWGDLYAYLRLGNVTDSANKEVNQGSTIIILESVYAPALEFRYFWGYGSSILSPFKQTKLEYFNYYGITNPVWFCTFENCNFRNCSGDLYGCTLLNSRSDYPYSDWSIRRCNWSNCWVLGYRGVTTHEDNVIHSPSPDYTYYLSSASATINRDRLIGFSGLPIAHIYGAASVLTLNDVVSDSWILGANQGTAYRKYSYNARLKDKNGDNVTTGNVKLYDKDNNLVYNENTDSNGRTAAQLITTHKAVATTTWTYLGKFKRVVTDGIITQTDYLDITEKMVDDTITFNPTTKDAIKEIKKNRALIIAMS